MITIKIDPEDVSTTIHGLRVAADRFDEDAKVCDGVPGHAQLAEQFRQQAKDSRVIADALENGDEDDEDGIVVPAPETRRKAFRFRQRVLNAVDQ